MSKCKKIEEGPFQNVTAEEDERSGLLEIDTFYLTQARRKLKKYLEDVAVGKSADLFTVLEGAYGCGKTATIDTFVKWINDEDLEILDNKKEKICLNFGGKKCYGIKVKLEETFTLGQVIKSIVDQIIRLMENEGIDTTDLKTKLIAEDMGKEEDEIKRDLEDPEKKEYVKRVLDFYRNVTNDNFRAYINLCLRILKEKIPSFGKLFIFVDEGELAAILSRGETLSKETKTSMTMLLRLISKKQQEMEIFKHSVIIFSFAEITREILEETDPELFSLMGRNPKKILIGKTDDEEFKEFSKFVICKRLEKWKEKNDLSSNESFYPIKETLIKKIAYDPYDLFGMRKNIRIIISIFKSLWDIWKNTGRYDDYIDESLFVLSFERILDEMNVPPEMRRKFDEKFKLNIKNKILGKDKDRTVKDTAYNLFETLIGRFVFGAIEKEEFLNNLISGRYEIRALRDFDSSKPYHRKQRKKYIGEAYDLLCSINKELEKSNDNIFNLDNGSIRFNEENMDKILPPQQARISLFNPDRFVFELLDSMGKISGGRKSKLQNLTVNRTIERGLEKYWDEKTRKKEKGFKNIQSNRRMISKRRIDYVICDMWISGLYPSYKVMIVPDLRKKIEDIKNERIYRTLLDSIGDQFSILAVMCNDGVYFLGYFGKKETEEIRFLAKYEEELHLVEKLEIEDLFRLMLVKEDSILEEDEHVDLKKDLIGRLDGYGEILYKRTLRTKIEDIVSKAEYKSFVIETYLEDTQFNKLFKYDQNLKRQNIKELKDTLAELMRIIESRRISAKHEWEEFITSFPPSTRRVYEDCMALMKDLNFVTHKRPGNKIEFSFEKSKGYKKVKEELDKLFIKGKGELSRKSVYKRCLKSKSTQTPRLLINLYLEILRFSGYVNIENGKIILRRGIQEDKKQELEEDFRKIREGLTILSINGIDIEMIYKAYISLNELFDDIIEKRKRDVYNFQEAFSALKELQSGSEIEWDLPQGITICETEIEEIKNVENLARIIEEIENQISANNEYLLDEDILKKISGKDVDTALASKDIDTKDLGYLAEILLNLIDKDKKENLYTEKFYSISKNVDNLLSKIDESVDQISEYEYMKKTIGNINELIKKSNEILETEYDEFQSCYLLNIDSLRQFIENEEFQYIANRLGAIRTTIGSKIKNKEEWIGIQKKIKEIKEVKKEISDIEIDTKLVLPQEMEEKEEIRDLEILEEIKNKFNIEKEGTETKLSRIMKMCEILVEKSKNHGQLNKLIQNAQFIQDKLRKIKLKIEKWEKWTDKLYNYANLRQEYEKFEKNVLKEKNVIREMIKSDKYAPSLDYVIPDTYMEILQDKFKQEKKLRDIFIEYRKVEDIDERNKKLAAIIELICLGLLE